MPLHARPHREPFLLLDPFDFVGGGRPGAVAGLRLFSATVADVEAPGRAGRRPIVVSVAKSAPLPLDNGLLQEGTE